MNNEHFYINISMVFQFSAKLCRAAVKMLHTTIVQTNFDNSVQKKKTFYIDSRSHHKFFLFRKVPFYGCEQTAD